MSFTIKSMSCSQVMAMLDRFAAGDLPPGASTDLQLHVNRCEGCQKELRVLERVVALVEGMDRSAPPPDLWQKVQLGILDAGAPAWHERLLNAFVLTASPVRTGRMRWAGALAASAVVASVVGASTFLSHGTPPSVPATFTPPVPTGTEVASYASQAQQVSYYDPLADRATLGAMAVTVNTRPAVMDASHSGGVQVTDAMARGMSAMGGGSSQ
ncbi:MAG: zf-HC2 domain-containing protein [Chloroflexi bacterium]|nr:zf-HC2 domain-containing protein [Chloroflexota bacterium]